MSDLTDAIGTAITGAEPVTVDDSLGTILGALVKAAGSAAGAARTLGVSPTTFYRWRNAASGKSAGVHQNPKLSKQAMVSALRHIQAPPSTMKPLIRGEQRLVLDATCQVSSEPPRRRRLSVGREIPPRKFANVLRAWLAGDDARADRLMLRHMAENYVEGMTIIQAHGGWFE